ncbi:hypothetical protein GBAR_LOCUS15427 [Geodia barretti]|uniref:Uncharacterized protein n=1 Tax=Geodia barretti TaxID=519541 RepID=A0AA35WNH8_GEOBA|nr:hypothetical protein GBAR_LOCUS15427 [Geodia barretti]
MCNTTLSVSISAHNCVACSDFFQLQIQYDQDSAGDRLEPDYNMENNPLYEMGILSNEGHSHKTQTPAPVLVYETVDSVAL